MQFTLALRDLLCKIATARARPAHVGPGRNAMPSPAVSLWPQWLRITVVGIATAAAISGGWLAYRYFAKPVYLTVAAGSLDGEALSLISAISARLAVYRRGVWTPIGAGVTVPTSMRSTR